MVKLKYLFDTNISIYKFLKAMYPDWLETLPSVHSITRGRTRQQNIIVLPRKKKRFWNQSCLRIWTKSVEPPATHGIYAYMFSSSKRRLINILYLKQF